jgi:hypothetical protein
MPDEWRLVAFRSSSAARSWTKTADRTSTVWLKSKRSRPAPLLFALAVAELHPGIPFSGVGVGLQNTYTGRCSEGSLARNIGMQVDSGDCEEFGSPAMPKRKPNFF